MAAVRAWQTRGAFNLEAVWAQIIAVPSPGSAPDLPDLRSLRPPASAHAKRIGRWRRARIGIAAILALTGIIVTISVPLQDGPAFWSITASIILALVVANLGPRAPRTEAERTRRAARARYDALATRWRNEAGDLAFKKELEVLERARREYLNLPNKRRARLKELETNRRQYQLRRFLDRYRIGAANIPGIGPGRTTTLQSYGIETAADVRRDTVLAVPGFGNSLTDRLVAWRHDLERKFVFDPNQAVDSRDITAVEKGIETEKTQIEQKLLNGSARLRQISEQVSMKRRVLHSEVMQALTELAQAEAELRAL